MRVALPRSSRPVLIAVAIAAAMLVPLALYGSVVRETIARDVVERNAHERELAAGVAAASVDRELRAAGETLVFFASAPTVRAGLADRDRDLLDARLRELLQGRRNSLGAVLDPAGIVLAAPLAPDLVGQDFSRRDYFKGAMASSGPYVSEIFSSTSPGNPSVVAVSYAIRSASTPLGVVVLTLLPSDLLDLLRPLHQVEGRELLVVDAAGLAVASTDPAFLPLSATDLAEGAIRTSNDVVVVAGRERVVTAGRLDVARWTLYVLDDPAVILRAERDLVRELGAAGGIVLVVALAAAGAVAFLYGQAARQRDELRSSRADLAGVNEALHEANRHKSEFLAGMSHELRTPLNAILGFSDLLLEQLGASIDERQARYLRNIKDAGSHLLGLINDVLDLAKVEAGRVELRPEPTTLEAVVGPLLQSTSGAASARGVAFETEVAPGVELWIDRSRARQILWNLLSNAVKFTPSGGSVRLRAVAHGRDLDLEVADTGIGIPLAARDRVFGTFERFHEGRSEAGGTGLGLALTKQLVELHQGAITFVSVEGQGTTFHVRLPEVVVTAPTHDRILVVEDDARDAQLVAALAANVGLESEIATTSEAALASIRRAPPVAVVLDMRLGDERGESVLEALRGVPDMGDIPVIVVTVEDDTGRSAYLGADAHLTKPIDAAALTERLRRARRERKEVAGAAAARR